MTTTDENLLKRKIRTKAQRIMTLAMRLQEKGVCGVFIDYSGHVEQLHVKIVESADKYENILCASQHYLDLHWSRTDEKRDKTLGGLDSTIEFLTTCLAKGVVDLSLTHKGEGAYARAF